ncbi:MAG: CPBP family intramembrane metalloprotease [Deltaproteobacteria bacterium]|nr:CPBP family intramembrane metalloprotease [Deltaproteobacteria bacterium]
MSRSGLVAALYGALALAAILIAAGRDDMDIYRWSDERASLWLLLSPLLGLALGLLVVAMSRLATLRFGWARNLHRSFRELLGELSSREILILALASSIGEELLFRGALQPAWGLWVQAAVFALLHIGPSKQFLPWTLWAFAMGLVFGLMFEWTGNLGAPIVAHFAINYLNLRYISRTPVEAVAATELAGSDGPAAEVAVS